MTKAASIRAWMHANPGAHAARSIRFNVMPHETSECVGSILSTMVSNGQMTSRRVGDFNRYELTAKGIERAVPRPKPESRPRKAGAQVKARPTKQAKPRPVPPAPTAAVRAGMDNIARDKSRAATLKPPKLTQPCMQLGSVITGIPAANEVYRERIAADLDAFHARGGRVDVLAPGTCSQPLKFDHNRAKNRA